MALSVELLTTNTKKPPATTMSSARLPGYGTGFGSISTNRRPGPVGPNPLPKKLGTLAKGRTPNSLNSPRQLPAGVNAASVRIAKQSNSAGNPKPFDRNLNNVKPIKEIRRNGTESEDARADKANSNGSSDASSGKDSAETKRQIPESLSMDFIKHALSSNKQIYSPHEIKMKAETSWKSSGKPGTRRPKAKTGSPKEKTPNRAQPNEPPKSKLIESIQNEGFAPRVKRHELTSQLKILKQRLGGESALVEEEDRDTNSPSRPL